MRLILDAKGLWREKKGHSDAVHSLSENNVYFTQNKVPLSAHNDTYCFSRVRLCFEGFYDAISCVAFQYVWKRSKLLCERLLTATFRLPLPHNALRQPPH